uniref:Uncharacterized protein LOC107261446 n=1 Tax=Rhizophora mucronata TaxID=61149 RepID=A0A2P2N331_RHIMU
MQITVVHNRAFMAHKRKLLRLGELILVNWDKVNEMDGMILVLLLIVNVPKTLEFWVKFGL